MSSEEDEDIPPTSECEKLCESFAEITGTDAACAQFYLQDRKWNLERSVNDFFEDRKNKGAVRLNNKDEAEVVVVLDGSQQGLAAAATAVLAESALCRDVRRKMSKNSSASCDGQQSLSSLKTKELKFITWNMDGLNDKNLVLRTKAICKRILNEEADIVFLQEVVPESAAYFLKRLTDYDCTFGNEVGYFVGTFIKKSTVKFEDYNIIHFPNTRMMRNILQVNARLGSVPLCLMNAHLESSAESSDERKCQMKIALKRIHDVPDDHTVIFGGDLNLRDRELTEIGGLPAGVEDVWVTCGSRKEVSYTWDMTRNDNLEYPGRFKPRLRFDRVYIRGSSPAKILSKYFGLIGLERLLPHRCFPSDHWGILCHFGVQ